MSVKYFIIYDHLNFFGLVHLLPEKFGGLTIIKGVSIRLIIYSVLILSDISYRLVTGSTQPTDWDKYNYVTPSFLGFKS